MFESDFNYTLKPLLKWFQYILGRQAPLSFDDKVNIKIVLDIWMVFDNFKEFSHSYHTGFSAKPCITGSI